MVCGGCRMSLPALIEAVQAEMTAQGYCIAPEAFAGPRGIDIPATIMGRAYCIDVSMGGSSDLTGAVEQTAELTVYVYLAGATSDRLVARAATLEALRERIWTALRGAPGTIAVQASRADLAEVQGGNAVLALNFTALYRG